jgi:CHASE3 domain sensor protein
LAEAKVMELELITEKEVLAVFVLRLVFLSTIGCGSYRSNMRLIQLGQERSRTHRVFEQPHVLISQLKDAETGQK